MRTILISRKSPMMLYLKQYYLKSKGNLVIMQKITGIKAISFDADRTLWDYEKSMRLSLLGTLKELEKLDPKSASVLDVEKMIKIREDVGHELEKKAVYLREIRAEAFRRTLEHAGRANNVLAAHLNRVYFKYRAVSVDAYDDVSWALRVLKERYVLGVVSNGSTAPDVCGLSGMFSFVILSDDCGVQKPDAKIFHMALKKAGCRKDEFLHVGDSLADDVLGAVNARVRSVWLNRDGFENTGDIKPDYEVSGLLELVYMLS